MHCEIHKNRRSLDLRFLEWSNVRNAVGQCMCNCSGTKDRQDPQYMHHIVLCMYAVSIADAQLPLTSSAAHASPDLAAILPGIGTKSPYNAMLAPAAKGINVSH